MGWKGTKGSCRARGMPLPQVSQLVSTPNFTAGDITVHLAAQVRSLGVNLPPTTTDIQSIALAKWIIQG